MMQPMFEKRKVEIDKDLLFKYKNLERDDLFFKDYYAPKVFCKLLQKKVSAVTIFSPLKVEMPNGSVEWAVSNVIEMGDPGQAKTILEVENLKYMQGTLSKLISVENSTMRGLIGAAIRNVQTGRWMVKVGDIPKRNGEYVVLDGFGMLAQEDCAQLRGIQEEKKFQINKAGSIEKECAVRMKCIANLVNPVSEYTTKHKATYDVSATTSDRRNKFSGADRRRFHHVLVVGDDDVLAKDIDMHLHKSYNPEKDKELIQYWNNLREFAWDLQPDSFIWKEGVDEYSIGKVNHLRTRYSNFLLDYAILSKKGSTCFLTQLPAVAIIHNSITPKMTVEIKKEHVDWLYSLYEEEFRDLGLSLENERRKFQELQADGILLSCPKKTIEYLALIWKCGSKSSVEESGKVSRRTLYRTFDAIISYQMITLQLKNGKEIEDPEEFHYSFNTGSGEIENKNKKNKTPISLIPDNVLPPINKRDGTLTPFGKILIQKAYHMHFSKLDKIKIKGVYQQ